MVSFEKLFKDNQGRAIVYDSKELVMLDKFNLTNNQVTVSFIERNSEWRQGIVIETKGTLEVNSQIIKNSIILWEDTSPKRFTIHIKSKSKELLIYNVWDNGDGVINYWHNGAAMWIVKKDNHRTYYCNDGYPDDDLNDLIFSISNTQNE